MQYLWQPGILAAGAVLVLYGLIFWSVDKGVSIDEGYYLLGYLKGQALGPGTTDFHRIVRTLFFFIPEDNVLMFRWTRVLLTIALLLLFLWSAYQWLEKQYKLSFNKTLYYSMGLLAGTMCFAYASPVIYYDNIQLMIYLLVFSFFFIAINTSAVVYKYIWFSLLGFILVFGFTNYPPSGILLIVIVFFLAGIFSLPSMKNTLTSSLGILTGIIAGLLIYSVIVHDIRDFFQEAVWAYENSAKSAKDKYHSDGQFLVIGKYFWGMLKVYLPLLGLTVIYFLLIYKKVMNRPFLNIVFGLILPVFTYKFSGYFSNILLFPAVLLIIDAAVNMNRKSIKFSFSKNFLFALILIALPLIAVAGSNQRLEMKMVYFMPFWFLAYFMLIAEFKKTLDVSRINILHYTFIIVFFIVFATQGFLKHIHYNYSIKRSVYLIENAERFTDIGVSAYQRDFYENGSRELKKAGFKPGDEVLAFYETFMLVYTSGGYVPHRLTYSAEFFIGSKDNIPPKKAKFIIIDEYQVPILTEFLEDADWHFPESYNMVELGTDGHNLTQLGYNYLLFYIDNPSTE